MKFIIRKPNLEKLSKEGIPTDFVKVKNMFNSNLEKGNLKYIPRKSEITDKEIKELWVPNTNKNITYLAEYKDQIVASGTLFLTNDDNVYSIESKRNVEYALIFEPEFKKAGLEITKKVIEESKQNNFTFILHTSIFNKDEISIMEELRYTPIKTIKNYERYKKAGLDSRVYKYVITK